MRRVAGPVPLAIPASRVGSLYPRLFTADLHVPVVLGAALIEDKRADGPIVNAAIATDSAGAVTGVYRKVHLAPFGEGLPADWLPAALFPRTASYVAGNDAVPVTYRSHQISVFICYEVIFTAFVRSAVIDRGTELIVNVVNDAWFQDVGEAQLHLAAARLRAVENRRFVVRAATTGISAIIDPLGRLQAAAPAMTESTLLGKIVWRKETTAYQVLGNAPWCGIVAALVAALALRRKGTRENNGTPRSVTRWRETGDHDARNAHPEERTARLGPDARSAGQSPR